MIFTESELIAIRRDLHQIPEIGLKEFKTHDYLMAILEKFPQEKLVIRTQETAITVRVKGNVGGKTIGWRTDIDGLPIKEMTDLSYKSTHDGFMHACGHDFHMTIALGLIQRAIFESFEDDHLFFFQPAEENVSGAKIYFDNGFFKEEEVDEVYALHVAPQLASNTVATLNGTLFAGACRFVITFVGKEGHAAFPHEANDTIVAAASFVQQTQTIISRNVNPTESAVITFGEFNGGTADNIVAGKTVLTGTIRTLSHEINELTQQRMKAIAQGIALSFGCEVTAELDQQGYVPVVNDEILTANFIEYMTQKETVDFQIVPEMMTAEDFGYFLTHVPGTMFWYGVGSEYGLHHSQFNPDESALFKGVEEVHQFLRSRDGK